MKTSRSSRPAPRITSTWPRLIAFGFALAATAWTPAHAHARGSALLHAHTTQAEPATPTTKSPDTSTTTPRSLTTPDPNLDPPGLDAPGPDAAPTAPPHSPMQIQDLAMGLILIALVVPAAILIHRRKLWLPLRSARWPADPPPSSMPEWPIMFLGAIVIWFAQQMGAFSAQLLFGVPRATPPALRDLALISLGGYLGAAVGIAFVLGTLPGMARLVGLDHLRHHLTRDSIAGIKAFALVFPIVLVVGWLASALSRIIENTPPDPLAHETLRQLADPAAALGTLAPWWWITVLGVTCGAPVVEEIVYRGFAQSALRRALVDPAATSTRRRWIPILIVSSIFTLMHVTVVAPYALATLFVLSLGFAIAYERSGRLIVPIVMHILFNLSNILLAMLGA